jgi:secondary thiamine-phosphate synthase enzyme
MKVITKEINFATNGEGDVIDVTPQVEKLLKETNFKDGIVSCFIHGSTAGITTIEYEPGLKKDLPKILEKLIPKSANYNHNLTWGDGNGYAHLRHALIGPSLAIPFKDKKLILGTWQQIVFLEFDNRKRNRRLILQFIGE